MKAAIFNPYLDTLGGGERYTMAVATTLANVGYQVDVEWKNQFIRTKLENRFGINLEKINFVQDVERGNGYDVCFWVSDGSIPLLRARKNFLHFQIPFCSVGGKTLINKMKLFRIDKIICNSNFTKSFIDQEYDLKSVVVYPPVAVEKFKSKRKENMICYVGRFSQLKQAKRQDILIDVFKRMCKSGLSGWKLILAGGVEVGAGSYLKKLIRDSENYPIEILKSPSFKQIVELYGKAKIFWSASGFGINENKEPEKVEHFGISVVEAMSARVVPIVFSSGGHKEIIKNGLNGYLWSTTKDLLKTTYLLIEDKGIMSKISRFAHETSKKYSYQRFEKEIVSFL